MSLFSEFRVRARALFGRRSMERDMDDELVFHIERHQAQLIAGGLSAEEARRRARAAFGGIDVAREGMRDERGIRWLEDLWRDVRRALRSLTRRPLFWMTASVTLGLGIAAATAIYSLVSMVLLRPLDVPHPEQLVVFGQSSRQLGGATPSVSYPTLRDIRAIGDVFAGVSAHANDEIGVQDSTGGVTRLWYANGVTGEYFTVLGLRAAVGRLFSIEEERRREQVVVLSHSEWATHYGRDPRVIGRVVHLNGTPFTIIGVTPEGWRGLEQFVDAQAYYPLQLVTVLGSRPAESLERRGADFLRGIARLREGKTVEDARAALKVLAARIAPERGEKPGDYHIITEYERRARPVIVIADVVPAIAGTFLALAMLALVIACVNVGNLVLSRTVARGGELAIRRALGASRARVMRELLAESLVLGVSALGIAIPVAWLVVSAIANLKLASDIPLKIDARLDTSVLAFCGAIAVVAGLLTGVMPALRGSANMPGTALRESGSRSSGTAGRRRLGRVLLVGQLAFSLILVIAGALFMRSLQSTTSLDLGVDPEGVVMASVDLSLSQYTPAQAKEFYRRVEEEMGRRQHVESVTHLRDAPMGYSQAFTAVQHLDGRPIGELPSISAHTNDLTPAAFRTLRLRLLEGRALDQYDDSAAPRRALVNETFARRMWPELLSVIGQRFRTTRDSTPIEIVGVIHGVTAEFPTEAPVPQYFLPYAQQGGVRRTIYARVSGSADAAVETLRTVIHDIDPTVAVTDLRSMYAFLHNGKAFFLYRLASTLTTAIGLLGLLQTLVGLYGVIAYGVSQRSREFGIRLALGAANGQLVRGVMTPAAAEVGLGAALGVAGAAALLPAVGTVLSVSPRDPATYAACTLGLIALALVALYLPARRAARAGAMTALRSD